MSKTELIRVLILLSQMEGFLLGKVGNNCLSDGMENEISDVCELLAKKIKEGTDEQN